MGFHGEALLAPRPTPKLEDHPSTGVRDCLFNLFAATLHIGGRSSIRNLRTRHAVVTGTHFTWIHLTLLQLTVTFIVLPTSLPSFLQVTEFYLYVKRSKRDEVTEEWRRPRNEITIWSALFNKYYSGDQVKLNDKGWACCTYGRQERSIQGFCRETLGKEATWKTLT